MCILFCINLFIEFAFISFCFFLLYVKAVKGIFDKCNMIVSFNP